MSHFAWIDIEFGLTHHSVPDIIRSFLSFGWSLDDYGQITFLPIGDQMQFNWTALPFEEMKSSIFDVLQQKEKADEIVGIVLLWQDSQVGGELVFRQVNGFRKLSFSASINRQELSDFLRLTDVNWYVGRLLPPLMALEVPIQSVNWTEHI